MTITENFAKPDIAILIFLGFWCIIGFAKGAIKQFFSILAFTLAAVACIAIPYFVNIPAIDGSSPVWGFIIFSVLIWIPSFIILNVLFKFIANRMAKKGTGFAHRLWGFAFGGLKGAIIVILVVFLLDSIPGSTRDSIPVVGTAWHESRIVSALIPYNPLLKIRILQNLGIVISVITNPEYMELLSKDPDFQLLKNQPSIKAVLNNPELKKILEEHQYLKFLTHPAVQSLIKDPEAVSLLLKTDVDKSVIKNI